jgi:hypothetical protein
MTNIIQVQNRLKSVPDETLISEIQQPTGQAPSFLVLNELNRRKNDRAEYARRQQEGPQTTVAEDVVRPAAPPVRPPMGQAGPPMPPPQAMGAPQAMPPQQQMAQQPPMRPQPVQMNEGGLASLPKFAQGGGYNMLAELASLNKKWTKTPAEIARQKMLTESLASARGGRSELDLPATVGQPSFLSRALSKAKSYLPAFDMGTLAEHRQGQHGDFNVNLLDKQRELIQRKIAGLSPSERGPVSKYLTDVVTERNAPSSAGTFMPDLRQITPPMPSRLDIAGVGGENPPDTFDRASAPGWYGGTLMPDLRQIKKPVPSAVNVAGFTGPYDIPTGAVNKDAAAINYASAVLGAKSDVGRYNKDVRVHGRPTPFLPVEGGQPPVGPVNLPPEAVEVAVSSGLPRRTVGDTSYLSDLGKYMKGRDKRVTPLRLPERTSLLLEDDPIGKVTSGKAPILKRTEGEHLPIETGAAQKILSDFTDLTQADLASPNIAQAVQPKVVPAAVASRETSESLPTKKVVSNGLVGPSQADADGVPVSYTSAAFSEPVDGGGDDGILNAASSGPNVGPFSVSPLKTPDKVELQTEALLKEIKNLEADAPTLNADTKITDLQNRATKIDEERGSTAARRMFEAGLNIMAEAGKPGASFGGTIPSILRAVGTGAAPAVSAYGKDVAALEARKDALQSKIVDAQLRGDANAIQQHTNSLKAISDRIGLLQAQQRLGLDERKFTETKRAGVSKREIDEGGLKVRQDTLALHRDTENRLKKQFKEDQKLKVFESLQRTPDATKFRNDYYHALYTSGKKEDQKAGLSNGIRRTSGKRLDGSIAYMYTTEGKAGAKHAKKWKTMGSGSQRAFNELAAGQQRIVRQTRSSITSADKALKADPEFRNTVRQEKVNINKRITDGKLTVPAGKTKAAFLKEELEKFKRTLPAYANKIGLEADLKNALALSKRYSLQAAGETTDDKADAIPVVRNAAGKLIINPSKD